MVGPRFSVNALAETKFIFRPEGDDRLLANAQEVSNPPAGNLTQFWRMPSSGARLEALIKRNQGRRCLPRLVGVSAIGT